MKLRKLLILGLSLISTLSFASNENDQQSLITYSVSPVAIEQVSEEAHNIETQNPPLSPRSVSRKAFDTYLETFPNSNITINLEGITHEKFISLQRLLHGLNISHQTPTVLTEAYEHVKPLYQPSKDKFRHEFNILNLGGGGTRGLLQAMILNYFEKTSGKSTFELFDLVIGTSTGCFTVAGACFDRCQPESNSESDPISPTGPYTAEEIANLYTEEAKVIFGSYYYSSMRGMRGTQYDSAPLEKVAQKYFGDQRLGDAKIPVIFTVQDLNMARPFLYCSDSLKKQIAFDAEENKLLRDIIREVTSAPNYFDPVTTKDGKTAADCGITNNNPVLFALSEGSRIFNVGLSNLNVFSLETGFVKPKPNAFYKNLGALSWFEIISTNIFNGESQHCIAEKLIKANQQQDLLQGKGEYFRIQFDLPLDLSSLDKYEPKFFEGLKEVADTYIKQNKSQLDSYIEKLMRAKGFI